MFAESRIGIRGGIGLFTDLFDVMTDDPFRYRGLTTITGRTGGCHPQFGDSQRIGSDEMQTGNHANLLARLPWPKFSVKIASHEQLTDA
jgi:hypothetical protein